MLSTFDSYQKNLLFLRCLIFFLLGALLGLGMYFMMTSQETLDVTMNILIVVLVFFVSLVFTGYDILRNLHDSSYRDVVDSKRVFLKYLSHKICNPLNSVHWGLTLLTQEINDILSSSRTTEASVGDNIRTKLLDWVAIIEDIDVSIDRVVNVLNRLIHSDELASGSSQIARNSVHVQWLLNKSVNCCKNLATQSDVTLQQEWDAADIATREQWRIVGDEEKLEQVLCMLIGTAIKAAGPQGQVSISASWYPDNEEHNMVSANGNNIDQNESNVTQRIEKAAIMIPIDSDCDEGMILIQIKYSGCGCTSEQCCLIFDEDVEFNLDMLSLGESSELELWISKGIVELHGGKLSAISLSDKECDDDTWGSSFIMELPALLVRSKEFDVNSPSIDNVEEIKQKTVVSSPGISLNEAMINLNVLVVEDSQSSRKILCRLLRNLGCNCIEATNGVECIDKVKTSLMKSDLPCFDLILMDFEMPQMNGPDAATNLREEGILTPIIGITGNVLPEEQQYYRFSGANRVLKKPLNLNLLKRTMLEILTHQDEISYVM